MRVISQDGEMDFPYENTFFELTDGDYDKSCIVLAHTITDYIREAARYSTKRKAIKAMKMLRQCYVGKVILENTDVSDDFYEQLEKLFNNGEPAIISVCTDGNQSKIEQFNSVFQFPADDEIEV
jgi:ribosomal protein L31E